MMTNRWRGLASGLAMMVGMLSPPLPLWATDRITIAYTPILLTGLIPIAQQNGYFKDEDLEVVLKTYPTGANALDAMLSGQTDMATVADIPFMLASFTEKDLHLIATIGTSDNDEKLVTRQDRGIRKASELRGHTIGVQSMTSFHYFLYLLLQKYGIEESEVRFIYKKANELPIALANGEIDAFTCREPIISQTKQLLGDQMLILEEPGLYQKSSNLVARQSFLDKSGNPSEKFLRALYNAEVFAYQSQERASIMIANTINVPLSTITLGLQSTHLRLTLTQVLLFILENEAEWAIAQGWSKGNPMPNFLDHMDNRAMTTAKPFGITLIQ
ncbi:NitT/TauT family transport system substrate-binding protein [Gammaproteobacteria bacterium]